MELVAVAAVDWVSCEATVVDEGEAMVTLAGVGGALAERADGGRLLLHAFCWVERLSTPRHMKPQWRLHRYQSR